MVLRKLIIEDFLSIRGKIEVDLDKRITILLGANDHGKSNILRALRCLNDDQSIDAEERNWDAETEPSLTFHFQLSDEERADLHRVYTELHHEYEEVIRAAREEERAEEAGEVANGQAEKTAALIASPPPPAAVPSSKQSATDDKERKKAHAKSLEPLIQLLAKGKKYLTNHHAIQISRVGIGSPLLFDERLWPDLDEPIRDFFNARLPQIELFQSTAGTLQDSVTEEQIGTEEYEFLQGAFFFAGLDPLNCEGLFEQNDATERRLDKASEQLDSALRRIWAQGVDLLLHFQLRHRHNSIEFLANDPAVTSRKTRMSKRSAGVTQFFRLSMVLHARRKKHPANSYIFLFDEPGIYLHPKGQKDLMQVFEQLADDAQIVYATHSLFLLNQNYPERHRLIVRDAHGTKIDQKPYRANWRYATDALGIQLTANILFSPCVLLVEGDSDPIYIYELFRQLNRAGKINADANMLGIYSCENLPNLRYLLQTFRHENHDAQVAVLCDGDAHGKRTYKLIKDLCEARHAQRLILEDGCAIEDYALDEDSFLQAAIDAIRSAAESESKPFTVEFEQDITASWREHLKNNGKNCGEWFKKISIKVLDNKNKDGASKVALARNYAFLCREKLDAPLAASRTERSIELCSGIIKAVSLPGTKAPQVIEVSPASA
jgi:predicted ATP-dependent endonuclease of OLD family